MSTQLMKMVMSFVVLVTLAACSKGASERSARATDGNLGATGNTSTCSSAAQAVGRVYDGGVASGGTFEQRVKGLLSATVDPQYFGTISGDGNDPSTGVTIEGRLRYDGAGNVLMNQTNLKLVVTDSFVGQKDSTGAVIPAYPMNFAAASSGTVNVAAKTFTIVFKDSYGEITLNGSFNTSMVTGTISFANSTTVLAGGTPASGTLGAFQIATCGWIN